MSVKEEEQHPPWQVFFKGSRPQDIKLSFLTNQEYVLAKDEYTATSYDNYLSLAYSVRDRMVERWITTQQEYHNENAKRVYYLSMEFLVGRLLDTNMINLGLDEAAGAAVEDLELDIEEIGEQEMEAGLGNGGLGRLAACFLDSMATLGIPCHGYGIRYEYGIFRQLLINGEQVEQPDDWLRLPNPWEIARPESIFTVRFYGRTTHTTDDQGRHKVEWVETEDLLAVPYDVPVPGYANRAVNTLRLWSARSGKEFSLSEFNMGDYMGACEQKTLSENVTKVLYPNDNFFQGRELRLKQEYLLVAASVRDIIRRFKTENDDIRKLHEKVAIQLNDTHPALGIPELMRILIDEERLEWSEAWDVTVKTFAYTNHTLLPEALEKWSVALFERLLPRHLEIIYEINRRFLREVASAYPHDLERLERMSLIEEQPVKRVRMAPLAVIGSHSVNGVAELHSQLIKETLFRDFHEMFPGRFNNKTNGVTQRRWLLKANPSLSGLIDDKIGEGWRTDLSRLRGLEEFVDDEEFCARWIESKQLNKNRLAALIEVQHRLPVNREAIFDVQIKRIHEYKRQLLLALWAVSRYMRLKEEPNAPFTPRTIVFAGKAAPGYSMAKHIIHFINSVAAIINDDPAMRGKLQIFFLENYCVSLAEKIFPAADLSEQISTAGMEASGTGNMKFALNGALTIGTLDGANIEIAEEVGEENIFIFGKTAEEVAELKANGYVPDFYIDQCEPLADALDMIRQGFFSLEQPERFQPVVDSLTGWGDNFMLAADFPPYLECQERVAQAYLDRDRWTRMSILNVARSGKFSSDRTILEYNRDIWQAPLFQVKGRREPGGNGNGKE
jgi:starch phosphorylase